MCRKDKSALTIIRSTTLGLSLLGHCLYPLALTPTNLHRPNNAARWRGSHQNVFLKPLLSHDRDKTRAFPLKEGASTTFMVVKWSKAAVRICSFACSPEKKESSIRQRQICEICIFDPCECHMDLCDESCSSRRQEPLRWTLHSNCSTNFFHTFHACRHGRLLPFRTIFTGLDFAWRSQGQREAKPVDFIFPHTLHLIRMKSDGVMKQFTLDNLRLLLSKIY